MKRKPKRRALAKRFVAYQERLRDGAKPAGKARRFMEAYYATLKPKEIRHE